jgi:hypothetical protein
MSPGRDASRFLNRLAVTPEVKPATAWHHLDSVRDGRVTVSRVSIEMEVIRDQF